MKQRFSSLDIKVITHELSEALCGLRLSNIYDLSSRIFLFKFAKPNNRKQVVIDSGFRCHLTNFSRATAAEPSAFVARLRKFLRTRRITEVSQVGTDRVIQFLFSDGQYRLILEFFAGGNVILTDKELNIISLLRIVPKSESQEELRVGLKYSLESRQNFAGVPPLTPDRVREALQKANDRAVAPGPSGKKAKQKPGDAVRKALANSLSEFPPVLIEHALTVKHFDFTKNLNDVLNDEPTFDVLMEALQEAQSLVDAIMSKDVCTGYIIAKRPRSSDATSTLNELDEDIDKENEVLVFDDFHPFRPQQVESQAHTTILEIEGFNATVDQFFSSIESQKVEARLQEKHDNANRKLQTARNDHAARVEGLQQVQHLNVRKAQAIENSILWVSEACAAVNGLIAQGMDWVEIAHLIEMEQARRNPVAQLIQLPLKLYENTVTLLLAEDNPIEEDEDDDVADETESEASDGDENPKNTDSNPAESKASPIKLSVDIDLSLTPWANAGLYYDQKKSAAVKEEKTKQSSTKALKSTERKVKADLQKGLKQERDVLRPVRRQLWFEKFYYFVSSEGHLVVAGRDKVQTEVLYSRYFQAGDAWVHSDVKSAIPVIVKNKRTTRNSPIPPLTLAQAGNFCTISSDAWDSKAVMGAWWVDCLQVGKLDSTGQYLAPGDFIVKGEKQHLPPSQLLLGFGVMFRVTPESKAKHTRHRLRDDPEDPLPSGSAQADDLATDEQPLDTNISDGPDTHAAEDDIESDVSAADPDHDSISGEIEILEDSAPVYNNPLQSQTGQGMHSEQIGSQLQELSLEKASLADAEVTANAADDEDDDDDSDSRALADFNPSKEEHPEEVIAQSVVSDTQPAAARPAGQVRGKRGKRAKMKSKYADQDEEDRELAMQLLGSRPQPGKNKDTPETKIDRETVSAQQKEKRREQHKRTQDVGKTSEEERLKLIQSGQEIMGPEELADMDLVDNFVGSPLPGDEILDCLVVCGPWDAIGSRLRWKVKLQPGSVKKGKAVKEILAQWNRFIADREKRKLPPPTTDNHNEEKLLREEGEMVKSFKDVELIGLVPAGKVRLMTGRVGDKGKGSKQTGKGARGSKKKR